MTSSALAKAPDSSRAHSRYASNELYLEIKRAERFVAKANRMVEIGVGYQPCVMIDLSEGGCSFLTAAPLHSGDRVTLSPSGYGLFVGKAVAIVRNIQRITKTKVRVGAEFDTRSLGPMAFGNDLALMITHASLNGISKAVW